MSGAPSKKEILAGGGIVIEAKRRPTLRRQISIWASARQSAFGAILCLLCALGYSANSFLAKLLMMEGVVTPYFAAFSRQFFIVAFVFPMTHLSKADLVNTPVLNKHWKAIFVRCIFGSAALVYYLGLAYAPLADVGVIFTSSLPIFSGLFGRIFLRERIRYTDIIFMLAAAFGVVLILRPPLLFPAEWTNSSGDETSMTNRLIGGGCALLSAFFMSFAILGARSCAGEVHYLSLVFWNCLIGLLTSFSVMMALGAYQSPCSPIHRLFLVLAALSGLIGQAATTLSVRYISPVIVSLSSSVELAFLFLFQTCILGKFPHLFSIIGSSVIMCAMAILVVRSWIDDKIKQKENDPLSRSVFAPTSKHYNLLITLTK